jgi:hypothetical protein
MDIEVPLKQKRRTKKDQKSSHAPTGGNQAGVGRKGRRAKRSTLLPQGRGPEEPRQPPKVITPKAVKEGR